MPFQATSQSKRHKGWYFDQVNNRLVAVFNGTEVLDFDANDIVVSQALATAAIVATGAVSASTTVTAGTGLTVTTGNGTITAGDLRVTAGNVRLGAVSAFATTEPVSAVVMKTGTAPAGAITTSGGLFTDGTTVKKIIADGTVSDVQT